MRSYWWWMSAQLLVGCALLGAICGNEHENETESNKLRVVFSWRSLEFAFGSELLREAAIRSGKYRPGATILIDVDVHYGNTGPQSFVPGHGLPLTSGPMVFVAMPRLERGVPVTLGYVTDQVNQHGDPLIAPYPDWNSNTLGDCDSITSVYRVQIDECDRLWVLDTGAIGDKRVCPPQILSFSLTHHKLLSRYRFPRDQYQDNSLYVTPVVDVRPGEFGKCHDTFVYIADVTTFGLIVYDHVHARSWRIKNNLFYPYPPYGSFEIGNERFDLMDGILGLALSPLKLGRDRLLYFHSLASRAESWVHTSVIRNHTSFENNIDAEPRAFKSYPMERSSQSAAEAMDRDGVLFFGLMSDLAIACWNSVHYPDYGGKNIEKVVINPETLQFPSGLKVKTSRSGRQELWVSTASFQRYMSGTLHPNETNFRIQAGYVEELVRGTKCDYNAIENYRSTNRGRIPSSA